MICTNCFHRNTSVVNSRSQKKNHSVWRRRKCSQCGAVFTTIERPSLSHSISIATNDGPEAFNLGQLVISIAEVFSHAPLDGKKHALSLAETVETTLASQLREISKEDVEATVHQVLKRFDEVAALQYAAKHGLIADVSARRRGRPSIVSRHHLQ